MPRYQWSALNTQQVGAYAEYFVKMELTMYGFEVYTTEVDDHGIDFVARRYGGPFIEVQVKSLRYVQLRFHAEDKVRTQGERVSGSRSTLRERRTEALPHPCYRLAATQ